ncbi:uncharacterized protein N7473_013249 [Penicillium subrubescens]|uniref:uncharacterized protein n=1 Tax=Penicillium subrubescens TaxID=1316194 RepID=UPI0025457EC8|nr:uncharacterized protein N7473_013249 [Penicillium subrubescens]KAJ5873376.1 hypothetical protein N7473_013249 [Penicillium subrubescens]
MPTRFAGNPTCTVSTTCHYLFAKALQPVNETTKFVSGTGKCFSKTRRLPGRCSSAAPRSIWHAVYGRL